MENVIKKNNELRKLVREKVAEYNKCHNAITKIHNELFTILNEISKLCPHTSETYESDAYDSCTDEYYYTSIKCKLCNREIDIKEYTTEFNVEN